MKQLLQSLKSGKTYLIDTPYPQLIPGHLLIKTLRSLISPGTERMLLDFGHSSLLGKARSQPEKVKQVFSKMKTDGLLTTMEAIRQKIEEPIALGYSNVGVVLQKGHGVEERFKIGNLVLSNGPHAEVISVPQNLCCPVPPGVDAEQACFAVLGAVGLQGLRLSEPTLGEKFVVFGLGLIGLLTVQILRANGCAVMGVDPDEARCRLALELGASQVVGPYENQALLAANDFSDGAGVDGVIITTATTDDQPLHLAAKMCRQRGRLVLIGTTGMQLRRDDFYKKEISFQVSCSYGPGRYDYQYENLGHDYPQGFVRWTLNRNFKAVLELLSSGLLEVRPLITHTFDFQHATQAYEMILHGHEPYLGIILHYPSNIDTKSSTGMADTVVLARGDTSDRLANLPVVAVIGAGNFATRIALPALAANDCRLDTLASRGGTSLAGLGTKFNFRRITTNLDQIFYSSEINAVYISTRHQNHAELAVRGLENGKNILVEKPLCINHVQLDKIKTVLSQRGPERSPMLMVGFNRRFAPMVQAIKKLLSEQHDPICINILVNAGSLPPDHWTLDYERGGGRLVGEACHFIDLCRFLTGFPIISAQGARLGQPDASSTTSDKLQITLAFADGSLGSIQYLANGHNSIPKERIEIFRSGKVIQIMNFRAMKGYGWRGLKRQKHWRQEKGHQQQFSAWLKAVATGGAAPIPLGEIMEVAQISLDLAKGLLESPVCQIHYCQDPCLSAHRT